ncbi:MAG: hypothetical protein ACMXYF_02010 [Candidatus Woesearchaeota archaeon]
MSRSQTVFAFILVWCIVYGILSFTNIFELDKGVKALIAVIMALITLIAPPVLQIISFIVPWFTLMFLFIFLVMLALMMLGAKESDFASMIKPKDGETSVIKSWIIIISAIIFVAAIGFVFFQPQVDVDGNAIPSQDATVTPIIDPQTGVVIGDVGDQGASALFATLFHPKVLGMLFILILGLFAVLLLTKK